MAEGYCINCKFWKYSLKEEPCRSCGLGLKNYVSKEEPHVPTIFKKDTINGTCTNCKHRSVSSVKEPCLSCHDHSKFEKLELRCCDCEYYHVSIRVDPCAYCNNQDHFVEASKGKPEEGAPFCGCGWCLYEDLDEYLEPCLSCDANFCNFVEKETYKNSHEKIIKNALEDYMKAVSELSLQRLKVSKEKPEEKEPDPLEYTGADTDGDDITLTDMVRVYGLSLRHLRERYGLYLEDEKRNGIYGDRVTFSTLWSTSMKVTIDYYDRPIYEDKIMLEFDGYDGRPVNIGMIDELHRFIDTTLQIRKERKERHVGQ